MNLNASYGYNNAASTFENIYVNPNQQALVNLGISMPILDWGRTKARMEQSRANQRLTEYSVEQEKINFEQEIYTMARNFQMLEDRLEITELSDKVADKRYEISRDRYLTGRVTITDLNIAQTEKDANKRAYIASLREYWSAYYQLRQLTLYDFETDSLLYIPEGNKQRRGYLTSPLSLGSLPDFFKASLISHSNCPLVLRNSSAAHFSTAFINFSSILRAKGFLFAILSLSLQTH